MTMKRFERRPPMPHTNAILMLLSRPSLGRSTILLSMLLHICSSVKLQWAFAMGPSLGSPPKAETVVTGRMEV
jgi:hypothetical protein